MQIFNCRTFVSGFSRAVRAKAIKGIRRTLFNISREQFSSNESFETSDFHRWIGLERNFQLLTFPSKTATQMSGTTGQKLHRKRRVRHKKNNRKMIRSEKR